VATTNDDTLGDITLLKITIETGRMHQIRVHLAHIGFPVLGDIMYGSPVLNRIAHKKHKINRQLLHASEYSFYDSIQNKQITIAT
jgi:23S rRNA-/tRNA-specific pseudouridylate synthase